MTEKKSFVLYLDSLPQWDMLTDAQAGVLIKALFHYHDSGARLNSGDGMLMMAFSFLAAQIDRDSEKWEHVRESRASSGKKGGAPRGNTNAQKQAKQANGCFVCSKQAKQAKQAVNVNVNDNVNDNVNVSGSVIQDGEAALPPDRPQQQQIPPDLETVRAYAQEIGSAVDAAHFMDYYQGNGWMCGRNPMRDWKAVFRIWTQHERKPDTHIDGTPSLDIAGIDRLINNFGGDYE